MARRIDLSSLPERGPNAAPVVRGRYRVVPDHRLSEFDFGEARAYAARDLQNGDRVLFARICEPGLVPRLDALQQMQHWRETRLMQPVGWGALRWPPNGEERVALIFERPPAPLLMPSLKSRTRPIAAELLSEQVLGPVAFTLQRMSQRSVTHQAIRPDNIYAAPDLQSGVLIGDCFSLPAGRAQHPLFETIELTMTPPLGRGAGNIEDDLYALGATMLMLAVGCCPAITMGREELLRAKLERGSFATLLGGESSPLALREPLRGLLSDDRENRWQLEDLLLWLGGTLRRTVRPSRRLKAERPFELAGEEHRHVRAVADAFGRRWESAAAAIAEPAFVNWLRRNVSDPVLADAAQRALSAGFGDGGDRAAQARTLARICLALDPVGPIRYRGLVLAPDGIGPALYAATREGDGERIALIAEFLNSGLAIEWYENQPPASVADLEPRVKLLRRLQQFLRHSGPGYGIERCLYELYPHAPCLSASLRGLYVTAIDELLPALEHVVERDGGLPFLVDRHVAGFIGYHYRRPIAPLLTALEDGGGGSLGAKLAMVQLFARVQQEHGPASLPRLTEWLAGEMAPLVKRYRSRTRRAEIERRLQAAMRGGNLGEIALLLGNERALKQDAAEFAAAAREHAALDREIQTLESAEFEVAAQRTGWRIAAGLGSAVAFLTVGALTFW